MVMAGLFRVMPKRQGLDFIMRGNKISSHDAERFGLVNKVVNREELSKEVNKIAAELSKLAPGTMKLGLKHIIIKIKWILMKLFLSLKSS